MGAPNLKYHKYNKSKLNLLYGILACFGVGIKLIFERTNIGLAGLYYYCFVDIMAGQWNERFKMGKIDILTGGIINAELSRSYN